ncbi:hypothetical protein [Paenibacillus glacialis]|uniref:hypothetical protein n=1 Tax=Paenibacillus glacialis TaxID=494026 RepID=UPI000AA441F6|nr:hypothetical protein [Paenibacillus glacialis]
MDLENKGKLEEITRDPNTDKGAEFIDGTTGIKWDIKSFESYPHGPPKKGAFTVKKERKNLRGI